MTRRPSTFPLSLRLRGAPHPPCPRAARAILCHTTSITRDAPDLSRFGRGAVAPALVAPAALALAALAWPLGLFGLFLQLTGP